MSYEYPPSQYILRYGQLQEESHYFCIGVAIFADKNIGRVKCNFEVAYTHDCKIIVVWYPDLKSIKASPYKLSTSCEKFIGRDIRNGLDVIVEGLVSLSTNHNHESTPTRYVQRYWGSYEAECYRARFSTYQIALIAEAEKELEREPKEYDSHFEITGFEFFDLSKPIYVPIGKNDQLKFLTLQPKRKYEQREYDNQTTGVLVVPNNLLFNDWAASDVADLWCALASLAMGRDIQWKSQFLPPLNFERLPKEKTWRRRKIHGAKKFHAYIAGRSGFDELQNFVQRSFESVNTGNMSVDSAKKYIHIFRQYVYYLTIGVADIEGISRLITTLTEEFLNTWVKISDLKTDKILTRGERNNLVEIIQETLESRVDEYLIEDNKINSSMILNRVIELIKQEVRRDTFSYRMNLFFREHGYKPEIDSELFERISAFIKTRDSIAHIGRLWHFNEEEFDENDIPQFYRGEDKSWVYEYRNALMMLPLMMFAVFGYHESYRPPTGWV